MQYTVVLTKQTDLNWRAFVPGWPECTAEASTRDEALNEIRLKLAEAVSRSEVVRLDLPAPDDKVRFQAEDGPSDEWFDYGIFSNDSTWRQLFAEIENNRNQHLIEE